MLLRIRIRPHHEIYAIFFLWGYDLFKFWVVGDFLASREINPLIFLFWDMVTVPSFIRSSSRMINSLAGEVLSWPRVLFWGVLLLFSTLAPYTYAGLAGYAAFTREVWILFWALVFLVLANLVRTIRAGVAREKGTTPGGR